MNFGASRYRPKVFWLRKGGTHSGWRYVSTHVEQACHASVEIDGVAQMLWIEPISAKKLKELDAQGISVSQIGVLKLEGFR